MRFLQLDVFTDTPYLGNSLAVFPEADGLSTEQMQAIANEMNLSETTFVTSTDAVGYDVRIFTPSEELPFAGHPTIGTCWAMRYLGMVAGDHVIQRNSAGETPVEADGERLWFERAGTAEADLRDGDLGIGATIAATVWLPEDELMLEARELGRHGQLYPAMSSAGLDQLMMPVRNLAALGAASPNVDHMRSLPGIGAYCFTAVGAGTIRARGFFPEVNVPEDPATGSAAASLGIYLADRLGPIEFEVIQGVEMGRESHIHVVAEAGRVRVGGGCVLVFEGEISVLPR